MDGDFNIIKGFVNGLEVLFLVSHNANGSLKVGVITTDSLGALSVTEPKLANDAVIARIIKDQEVTAAKIANALAGNGLLKAANGDPFSVDVDNVTIEIVANKLKLKSSSATSHISADTVIGAVNTRQLFPHGLASMPHSVRVVLVPTTLDAATEYTLGDREIDIFSTQGASNSPAWSLEIDAINVTLFRNGNANLFLLKKSTGVLTAVTDVANFRLRVYVKI